MKSEWHIGRVSGAEHPLIASYRSNAATDLVGQSLERESMVSFTECTGQRDGWAIIPQLDQKDIQRFGIAPIQHVFVSIVGNVAALTAGQLCRKMKTMNGVKEEQTANSIVEIFTAAAECIQLFTFAQQLFQREVSTFSVERPITNVRICRRDDGKQVDHDASAGSCSRKVDSARESQNVFRDSKLLPGCQQSHKFTQDQIAIHAAEGERKLSHQQAILVADVVSGAVDFQSQITFGLRQLVE